MDTNNYFRRGIMTMAIVVIAVFTGMLAGCQHEVNFENSAEFEVFEKDFVKSLSSEQDVVKLIGFETFSIADNEKQILLKNRQS